MRRFLVLICLGAMLVLAACGDDSGGGSNSSSGSSEDNGATASDSLSELLSRVSGAIQAGRERGYQLPDGVVYTDFVGARRQLDFPADRDVYKTTGGAAGILLSSVADSALPYASQPTATPLRKAIDGGAIKAAAGVNLIGPPSVLVIDTSQPFSEISANLRRGGYSRDGDLFVTDRSIYPVVADAGKGIVVAAGSKAAARAALGGHDAKLTRAAELIREVPGVARAANATRNRCIVARAAGQNLARKQRSAPQHGEYLLVIDDTADPAKLTVAGKTLGGGQGDLSFGKAEADGDQIRAQFRDEDPLNAAFREMVNDDVLTSGTELGLPYAC